MSDHHPLSSKRMDKKIFLVFLLLSLVCLAFAAEEKEEKLRIGVKVSLFSVFFWQSIHKMLSDGIDTWAPKVSVKKSVLYFLSRNITEEMHMGHFRSTLIGEALARMLEYSGVVVLRKRIHDEDHLDIEVHAVGLAV